MSKKPRPDRNRTIVTRGLDQVMGEQLIDIETNDPDKAVSECSEVVLHFTNGKEILIFVNDSGSLMIEGD